MAKEIEYSAQFDGITVVGPHTVSPPDWFNAGIDYLTRIGVSVPEESITAAADVVGKDLVVYLVVGSKFRVVVATVPEPPAIVGLVQLIEFGTGGKTPEFVGTATLKDVPPPVSA